MSLFKCAQSWYPGREIPSKAQKSLHNGMLLFFFRLVWWNVLIFLGTHDMVLRYASVRWCTKCVVAQFLNTNGPAGAGQWSLAQQRHSKAAFVTFRSSSLWTWVFLDLQVLCLWPIYTQIHPQKRDAESRSPEPMSSLFCLPAGPSKLRGWVTNPTLDVWRKVCSNSLRPHTALVICIILSAVPSKLSQTSKARFVYFRQIS